MSAKTKRAIVEVSLADSSALQRFENVRNTYWKADMFCVSLFTGEIYRYPMSRVLRVKESRP